MNFAVSCIGTRKLTPEQSLLCQQIGWWIATCGGQLHSGNASDYEGRKVGVDPLLNADYAFASGANRVNPGLVHLHQPWGGFNGGQIVTGNVVTDPPYPDQMRVLAEQMHGAWHRLKQGGQKLMTRNVSIVHQTNLCIAYPNNTAWGGGTGEGMKVAAHLGIEVIDLRHQRAEHLRVLYERIRNRLR
jgi:hypothetical protein